MPKVDKNRVPTPRRKPNKVSNSFLSSLYGSTETSTETPTTVLKAKAKLPFSDDINDEDMTPNHPNTARKKKKPPNSGRALTTDFSEEASLLPHSSPTPASGLKDVTGFLIICAVTLLGDTARGVMFPTLWPLVHSLGGTRVHQGIAVASFSFGRVIVSPMFGKKSVTSGYRSTLNIALSLLFLGTIAYSLAPTANNLYWLIGAQIVMGFGSGTLGVTRAYVAEITSRAERTEYIALLTAVQYGGFTVMPIVGSFFCSLFEGIEGTLRFGPFILNAFTAPGYFMAIFSCFCLILLNTCFVDLSRSAAPKKLVKLAVNSGGSFVNDVDVFAESKICCGLSRFDCVILFMLLLNVSTKGSIGVYETLTVNFATSHFVEYSSAQAGLLVSGCGFVGVVALLCMKYIRKCLSDVQMILYGMVLMVVGSGMLVHFGHHEDFAKGRFESAIFLLYAVGYPIGHTAVIGLFSKIVGQRPQGTLLGWFASAGSLARIFFPICSGWIAEQKGNSFVFLFLMVVLSVSVVAVHCLRRTLYTLSED